MSYEERVKGTYATDDPIHFQAFAGFDCMKAEAVKIAREADAEIQRLRTQLAESEQACAGYRAALEKLVALKDEYPTLPREICNAKQKVKVAWVESYRATYKAARAALAKLEGRE